jgi:hypothetical protein
MHDPGVRRRAEQAAFQGLSFSPVDLLFFVNAIQAKLEDLITVSLQFGKGLITPAGPSRRGPALFPLLFTGVAASLDTISSASYDEKLSHSKEFDAAATNDGQLPKQINDQSRKNSSYRSSLCCPGG